MKSAVNPNEHIENYLEHYIDLDQAPGFAVMIHGAWGSGKTHFITHLQEIWENKKKRKVIYVSLYGVSSVSDIQSIFFAQLNPVLAKKASKTAFQLGANAINFLTQGLIDKATLEESMNDWLSNINEQIVIFDDLERCPLPLDVILGYINSYVENNNCRVIILANENKINDLLNLGNDELVREKYFSTKEKLIGKTFHFTPPTDNALSAFISSSETKESFKILNYESILYEIHTSYKAENLRYLQALINDLHWIFNCFPETFFERLTNASENSTEANFLKEFIEEYAFYLYEIKDGNLHVNHIKTLRKYLLTIYYESGKESEETKNKETDETPKNIQLDANAPLSSARLIFEKYKNNLEKLTKLTIENTSTLSEKVWEALFKEHRILEKDLQEDFKTYKSWKSPDRPPWKKLVHLNSLTDEEFGENWSLVKKDLQDYKEKDLGALLHIFALNIFLSKQPTYNYKTSFIIGFAKKYFKTIINNGAFDDFLQQPDWSHCHVWRAYENVGYWANDTKEFQTLKSTTINQLIIRETHIRTKKANHEILNNIDNSSWLYQNLIGYSPSKYGRIPVFSSFDTDKFLSKFQSITPGARSTFAYVLKRRYQENLKEDLIKFLDEYPFIQALKTFLELNTNEAGVVTKYCHQEAVEHLTETLKLLNEAKLAQ